MRRYRYAVNTGGDRWRRVIATSNLGAWMLVICWALVVFVLLTEPRLADTGRLRMRFGIFAFGHGVFFGILGFLVANALIRFRLRRLSWWTVVVLTLYGILGELVQTTVPGRTPSIIDLGADTLGAFVGATTWTILARWQSGTALRRAAQIWRHGRPMAHELTTVDRSILS